METIDLVKFNALVEQLNGKIFVVNFVKKDGSLRKMKCRKGVKKFLTGTGMAYDPKSKGLMPVFDMEKREYRMVNLKTMRDCKIKGSLYKIMEMA